MHILVNLNKHYFIPIIIKPNSSRINTIAFADIYGYKFGEINTNVEFAVTDAFSIVSIRNPKSINNYPHLHSDHQHCICL